MRPYHSLIRWLPVVILATTGLTGACAVSTGTPARKTTSVPGTNEPDRIRLLEGVWMDTETSTKITIRREGSGFTVVSAIDDSGEQYRVSNVEWKDGVLKWRYDVASTGYQVNWATVRVSGDELECTWQGTAGGGTEKLKRVGAPPLVAAGTSGAVAGPTSVWEDPDTHCRYTIVTEGGQPRVVSAIDDDGEIYPLTSSAFVGGALSWSFHVPSTNYDVAYRAERMSDSTMDCSWQGTGGSGRVTLTRVNGQDALSALESDWLDTSATILMTVVRQGNGLTVTKAVDISDGEVFPVSNVAWNGGVLTWTTFVPSTKVTINWKTVALRGSDLETMWTGTQGNGTEVLKRQGPPGSGPKPNWRDDRK